MAGGHGLEVHSHAGLRVLGGENGIDVGVLIVVQILLLPGDLEQLPGQLEHVVGVAGLAGGLCPAVGAGGLGVQLVGGVEVLGAAVAAGDIGVVVDHGVPEGLCRLEILGQLVLFLLGQLVVILRLTEHGIPLQSPDELGDGGVGVLAVEHVIAVGQLPEQRGLVKQLGHLLVLGVAGEAVEFIEGVVHAAVLGGQHPVLGHVAHQAVIEEGAQILRQSQGILGQGLVLRLGAEAQVVVDLQQTRQHLVQVVVGYHHRLVGGAQAVGQTQHFHGESGHKAVIIRVVIGVGGLLTHLQALHRGLQLVPQSFDLGVVGGVVVAAVHHGHGGHVVPKGVAAEVGALAALPSLGIALGAAVVGGVEPCALVALVEEAVGVQGVRQIVQLLLGGVDQVVVGEGHILQTRVFNVQPLPDLGGHHHGELLALLRGVLVLGVGGKGDGLVLLPPYHRAVQGDDIGVGALPADGGTGGTLAGQGQVLGGAAGDGEPVQIRLGHFCSVHLAAHLLIEGQHVLLGCHLVIHPVLIQRSPQVGGVGFVHLAVPADALHGVGLAQDSGGTVVDAVLDAGGLGNAVAVDLHILGHVVIGHHNVGPLPGREKFAAIPVHRHQIGLGGAGADGQLQGDGVVEAAQIPAIGVVLVLVPGDDLLPSHGLGGLEPEGEGQVLGLELHRGAQVQMGPLEFHRLGSLLHPVHKGELALLRGSHRVLEGGAVCQRALKGQVQHRVPQGVGQRPGRQRKRRCHGGQQRRCQANGCNSFHHSSLPFIQTV